MRRLLLGLLALVVLALAGTAWLARDSFHREETLVPAGWSAAALADDTLLLQHWLGARGWTPRRGEGAFRTAALRPGETVLLLRLGAPITEADAAALGSWCQEGGTLLVDATAAPFREGQGTRALLSMLALSLRDLGKDRPLREETDRIHGEPPFRLWRSGRWRIQAADREAWAFAMGGKEGDVLLSRPWGRGRITVANDLGWLVNDRFGTRDHAEYLDRILGLGRRGGPLTVWSRDLRPSLPAWIAGHAPGAVVGVLVLLVAWLWRSLYRLGPLTPPAMHGRRDLGDHVRAVARFLETSRAAEHLLRRLREAVFRRARARMPAFCDQPFEAQVAWLAAAARLEEGPVADAWEERPGRTPHRLAAGLLLLARIHQRLTIPERLP